MPQFQKPLNPWLTSYISQNAKNKSRFEIDKYLIQAGYDPTEIELAWQWVASGKKIKKAEVNRLEIIYTLIASS
jgi:hypothetical protein